MNIEELVRIHENVYKWLVPHSVPAIFGTILPPDDMKNWAEGKFKGYFAYALPNYKTGLLSLIRSSDYLGAQLDPETSKIIEPQLQDPILWEIISTFVLFSHSDLEKFRKMEYDPNAYNRRCIENVLNSGNSKRVKDEIYPVLLSMLKIPPEIEKRDEALCGIFGSLYDLITSRTQDECNEITALDTLQFLRKLPEYSDLSREKRRHYGWACVISNDEIKAAISPLMINEAVTKHTWQPFADKYQQLMRESTTKDRAVSKYGEDNRKLLTEAERLRANNSALASERDSLVSKVKELEARPQTIVPVDAAQLQKELEAAREYENLFNLSDAENKELKARVSALEGKLAGITAQAQQRQVQENGAYESFALYTAREGYDADLAAAILRSNSKFRSNNMVPRSMMKKNAQNALEDKSKIKDFDKTLRWLVGMKVYNQKGDAFSTTINFSEIPTSDVRMYVNMLVSRE
jgi:hypothetical protein